MLDKEKFLGKYKLREVYYKSGLSWEVLQDIYKDYIENQYEKLQNFAREIVFMLEEKRAEYENDNLNTGLGMVHTIFGRAKNPEHLIEKIIRKVGFEDNAKYSEINKDNYLSIITDLIGIRILVLAKEDWKIADTLIRINFQKFHEPPKAYVCYGDRKIFDETLLHVDYTNKGYRSQHYIVEHKGYYAEIQVRTLAEEVHGEFDHRTRYPYKIENKFLVRYSKILSKDISKVDDLISTCLTVDEKMLEELDRNFKEDRYENWSKQQIGFQNNKITEEEKTDVQDKMNDVRELVHAKLLSRK